MHIAARLLQLFAFCTVSLVKQLPAWFISSPPDKETKHWFIMQNHVSTLPGSSSATNVIRISLDRLNRRTCQRTIQKKHQLIAWQTKRGGQWQTNRVRSSPWQQVEYTHVRHTWNNQAKLVNMPNRVSGFPWQQVRYKHLSHLKQSSKARQHASSCQWFPLAAVQI